MSLVAVVGLGYVGLPLAVAFGKLRKTIGYDADSRKINAIQRHIDPAREVPAHELRAASKLAVTGNPADLAAADYLIIDVPTPIDTARQPDLGALETASHTVGSHMKKGATVIYESTVYPGATEEVCVPLLEQSSGMKWKQDFHVAYSPERINPGDKVHTLATITKVVAGDDEATRDTVAELYAQVMEASVYRAPSIKVAEAAKVIENTQRDLNIALMNELAIIFNRLGIDTEEVLRAAETKWNFLPFRPGLVGGHCIGVDPYYLTHRAEMAGYHPHVILAGRRINDGMGRYVAEQTIKHMISTGSQIKDAVVNVLGITFKENVADLRNSRVIDLISELRSYGIKVCVHDPVPDKAKARDEYGIELMEWEELPVADAVILAVAHVQFQEKPIAEYTKKVVKNGSFIDVKSALDAESLRQAGLSVWRL